MSAGGRDSVGAGSPQSPAGGFDFDDARMELIMGRLLQTGVLLAASVVLVGLRRFDERSYPHDAHVATAIVMSVPKISCSRPAAPFPSSSSIMILQYRRTARS